MPTSLLLAAGKGLFTFILLVVVILAVVGLGWKTFSSGILVGFEKAVDVGTPIIKNFTQEAIKQVSSFERLNVG